jgi:hypothetical protein
VKKTVTQFVEEPYLNSLSNHLKEGWLKQLVKRWIKSSWLWFESSKIIHQKSMRFFFFLDSTELPNLPPKISILCRQTNTSTFSISSWLMNKTTTNHIKEKENPKKIVWLFFWIVKIDNFFRFFFCFDLIRKTSKWCVWIEFYWTFLFWLLLITNLWNFND